LIYFILFKLKFRIFPILFYFLQFLYLSINFTYYSYFKIYLTPQTATSLLKEGLTTFLKGSFPFYPFIILFLIDLPIFILLIYKKNLKDAIKFSKKIQILSLSFCIIFLFFYFLINVQKAKEKERIYEFTSDKRIVKKFGLTIYQINEIFKKNDYISKLKIPENIVKGERKEKYSNIIFIQVESLDSFIINEKYKDNFVMPYLNKLKSNSIYYPYVISYHFAGGTSDCEFTIFNSQEPIFDFPSINLLNYNYKNSFLKVLKKENYVLKAFHGNEGYFWNRSYALPAMGFDKFFDIYEMNLKVTGWGAKDEDVFGFVLKELKKEKFPFFYYIITMSSHVPFTNVLRHYKNERFNDIENRVLRNYFLSMNYVDRVLEKYLKEFMEIPDTYIFIYGDHVGLQREENFFGSIIEVDNLKFEFVPLIIVTPDKKIYKEENLVGSFLDLAPTALFSSGIEFNYRSDGQNLTSFPIKNNQISIFEKNYKRSYLYDKINKCYNKNK
jgi:phosphoglycerol transferase MdoB-like AlkP superfamily enzyme